MTKISYQDFELNSVVNGCIKRGVSYATKLWDLRLKMMLTEANYRILQPMVYTCRIFGLCPVIFNKVGNYYQMRYSTLLVFYSYAVLIIFAVGTILGVRHDMEAGKNAVRMKSIRTRYITLSDMAMVFTIALYGVISIPYRMKRFVRMLDIWSCVDKIIPITNYQKYRRCSIIFVLGTVTATVSLFFFDMFIYCAQWRVSNDPTFYFQNYISYYMLYFLLVFQEIFFWHLVFFIHIRLVMLNEHLSAEKANLRQTAKNVFFIPTSLNLNAKYKVIEYVEQENVKIFEKGGDDDETFKFGKTTAERMKELMNMYSKVKESVEILNESSSFGVVLLMLSCLVHLVVTPYFLLVEIIRKIPSPTFITLQCVWLLAHIGRLLVMVEPCQKCLKEYKIASNLVSELALMDFDKDTRKSLKTFASQFSNDMFNFNACGFFNIDRSLLTSVAGAVTTYLVILFQFNGNDGS